MVPKYVNVIGTIMKQRPGVPVGPEQVVVKHVLFAEVQSKGEALVIREKTGEWPVADSTYSVAHVDLPEKPLIVKS